MLSFFNVLKFGTYSYSDLERILDEDNFVEVLSFLTVFLRFLFLVAVTFFFLALTEESFFFTTGTTLTGPFSCRALNRLTEVDFFLFILLLILRSFFSVLEIFSMVSLV